MIQQFRRSNEAVIAFLKTAVPELASLNVEVLVVKILGRGLREAVFSVPSVKVAVHLHDSQPRVHGHKFRGIFAEYAHIVHSNIDAAKFYLVRTPSSSFASKYARTDSMTHVPNASASQSRFPNLSLAHKPTSSHATVPLASITNIHGPLSVKSTRDQSLPNVQSASSSLSNLFPDQQRSGFTTIKDLSLATDDCIEPLFASKFGSTAGSLGDGVHEGSSGTPGSRSVPLINQTSLLRTLSDSTTVSNVINDLNDIKAWANEVVADAQKLGGIGVNIAQLDIAMRLLYRPRSHARKRGWTETFGEQ